MKKRKNRRELGAVVVMILLILATMCASLLLSAISFDSGKTTIVNGILQTNLVTVKNIFSVEGFRYLVGNFASNLKLFEPFVLLISTLIGASIIESSGILKHFALKIKKMKNFNITLLVILISMVFTFLGDYSFLLLFPFIAILYKEMGRSPILGILTVFLGITVGYSGGIFVNYHDYILGQITETSAQISVDSSYQFLGNSYLYIRIAGSILMSFVLAYFVEKRLVKKLPRPKYEEEEFIEVNTKKGLILSSLTMFIFVAIMTILLLPNSFAASYMLDTTQTNYTAMLFSQNSPFREGIFLFILLGISISSYVYGTVTKKFKNIQDFSSGFSSYFDDFGLVFVLMFFASQWIAILNWTNIGTVISASLIELMSKVEFSGLPLIVTLFIFTVIIGIFITSTIDKWEMMAPLTVPLFMRANITPEFTQFIFKTADGIGKALTPIFPYYIILLGFVKKYNNDRPISLFGAMRLILPIVLISIGVWLLIIIGFYVIGLPIGFSGLSTL